MNQPDGKRLLAVVRGGDYAHPGEEEAIRLAWEHLPKNPNQLCLDAGCGRGGTAAFVRAQGWGNPTGVDIDAESIAGAAAAHPDGEFHAMDISQAGERFPGRFELIYAFNAFYAFPDQPAALAALGHAARPGAHLCLFDYLDGGGFFEGPFARKPETTLWQPIDLSRLPATLESAGWKMTECREISDDYIRWYRTLNGRFASLRETLLAEFPPALVDYATDYYSAMLQAIEDGTLGGAIILAERPAA